MEEKMVRGNLQWIVESAGVILVYAAVIGILMYPVWSATRVF
jgi:hypothetical protein